MNHLEQLVSEWLQFRGYFVRTSVQVGARARGGYEGELDVVAFHPVSRHLLHVECSLDSAAWEQREARYREIIWKRPQLHPQQVFQGLDLPGPDEIDAVAILQFASGSRREIGGGRLLPVRELIHEIDEGLQGRSPISGAVPSNMPLLRTLQLAFDARKIGAAKDHLIPRADAQRGLRPVPKI